MKMGKKVREYKSGDFIFAKVKGYPAWPARVQRLNGKKYFVYFYGTGETANLPPNMIFDYAENKDKFLAKSVKRRDFNDGVKQIQYDFANNVPLEQVIGALTEPLPEANDTANESATNDTMDDTGVDTTAPDVTMADDTNATQNDTAIEDSDDTGALVIDEGKKGRKSTAKTPAKETAKAKEPKTPRGKGKKEEAKEEEGDKKEEEIVSRSGRKIRPKRYIDEQTEENTTLPSPAPKKRRAASPQQEEKKEKSEPKEKVPEKNMKHFNTVTQSELEDIKEPFKADDTEKENILIAYIPSGQYVGIKLFQSRPSTFKNEAARLQWDKQSATNAITLKQQLEKGQISSQSVIGQLVTDLNLTDEEKATLDKERETEEKKSRVQFLKTEMKLIELDTKIKTCLCLEKADTDLCLKLLDELMELDVKPLMLLKHPSSLETVKRLRAYVGNTPSWDLSEDAAILFAKQAHRIRRQADSLYKAMKDLFTAPEGLSFWEYFSERVLHFKKVTSKLSSDELLEMVHEPIEMSQPTSHTMKSSVDAANEEESPLKEDDDDQKKKEKSAKAKKSIQNNAQKTPLKRQSSRKQEEKDNNKDMEANKQIEEKSAEDEENPSTETDVNKEDNNKEKDNNKEVNKGNNKEDYNAKDAKDNNNKEEKDNNKDVKDNNKDVKDNKEVKDNKKEGKDKESQEEKPKTNKEKPQEQMDVDKETNESTEKSPKETEDKDKQDGEPRTKRMRETKKTEAPPPRSPAKRKAKC